MIDAKLLQLALEASRQGLVITELQDGRPVLVYASPVFEQLGGQSTAGRQQQAFNFLLESSPSPDSLAILQEAVEQHQSCQLTLRSHRADGSSLQLGLSVIPLPREAGQPRRFIGLYQEISEAPETRERLCQLEEALQRLQFELAALRASL